MPMVTYPLNNIEYTAEDAELFHSTRTSGVYATNSFDVSVNGSDNTIVIGTGIAWIKNSDFSGKVVAQKESISLDLGLPDSVYPRIDAIVIQFDANKNATDIVVKNGTAASNPVAPAVVRTESVYELHLYHIRRDAGSLAISANAITDLRVNDNYCGLMSDSVTQYVDTTLSKSGVAADASVVGEKLKNKAPAGFGLGVGSYNDKSTSLTTKEQLDALAGNGFWAYRNQTDYLISGDKDTRYVYGINYTYSSLYSVQIGYCVYTGTMIKRIKVDSVWYDWEYENPPMTLGVEYRTTQRYHGKVVYVQAVNTGSFPNTSTKWLDTATLTYPIYQPLMAYGISSVDNRTIPHGEYIKLRMGWGYIEITTTDDYSSDSAVLTVWYIKE